MKSFFTKLADNPVIFNFLRVILEANFRQIKYVIKNECKIDSSTKLLDLGCGTGQMYDSFRDFNCNYTGADIDLNYIEFEKKKYNSKKKENNPKFIFCDARKMPFNENEFDFVFVFGVFHHLSDENSISVFKEINRIIKNAGKILIIEDIDIESKWDLIGNILRKLDKGNFIRQLNSWKKLFETNFEIKKTYRIKSGFISYQVFILK